MYQLVQVVTNIPTAVSSSNLPELCDVENIVRASRRTSDAVRARYAEML